MVFQDYRGSLLPWRTVGKNIELHVSNNLTKAKTASKRELVVKTHHRKQRGDVGTDRS